MSVIWLISGLNAAFSHKNRCEHDLFSSLRWDFEAPLFRLVNEASGVEQTYGCVVFC